MLAEIQRLKEEANRFISILAEEDDPEKANELLSPGKRQSLTREVESLQVRFQLFFKVIHPKYYIKLCLCSGKRNELCFDPKKYKKRQFSHFYVNQLFRADRTETLILYLFCTLKHEKTPSKIGSFSKIAEIVCNALMAQSD